MELELINFDINLFSIVFLIMMLMITKIKKDIFSFSSKLFHWIIIVNMFALIIEPITWFFDLRDGSLSPYISYTSNFILIILGPLLVGLWASYLDYKLFADKKRIIRRHYYQWPTYLTLILLGINFFYPVFFSIDFSTNTFSNGSLAILRFVLSYILYAYLIFLVIRYRHRSKSSVIIGIVIFLLLPTFGSLIQLFHTNLFFAWPSLALSVLVIYIFLETTSGSVDYLTKVYSRHTVEIYLNTLIEENKQFYLVLIDLDHFKDVNDRFGHQAGDQVLVEFANILKQDIMHKDSMVGRLGGDEFLIILMKEDEHTVDAYIHQIEKQIKEQRFLKQFRFLAISYGQIEYETNMTQDELLLIADHLMYKHKLQKKNEMNAYPKD